MDPDEQVRNTVNLLFRSFKRIGTALGTARYFETNCQQFPRRDGWGKPERTGRLGEVESFSGG
jgi:DNA invertase Pin-like site-specific DNA recombinase